MKLETTYLGLKLRNPLVVGASPLTDNIKNARLLQDAGAAAIVMRSLFEEQIDLESRALNRDLDSTANTHAEAGSYFPNYQEYQLTPDRYLHQLQCLKNELSIPVIASLNGCRPGGWTGYAQKFEASGADAIELNLYQITTDPAIDADQIEADMIETVRNVVTSVKIPVSVKLSPYHTAVAHFTNELTGAGAAGLVLFNRFYQPDLNIEELEVEPRLRLSDSSALLLRLRWLAILSPHTKASLAATGGIHTYEDIVKAILSGAHVAQVVSCLLKNGPGHLSTLLRGLELWMEKHEYQNIGELRGAMNHLHCPDSAAFERANYLRILQSWRA